MRTAACGGRGFEERTRVPGGVGAAGSDLCLRWVPTHGAGGAVLLHNSAFIWGGGFGGSDTPHCPPRTPPPP